MSYNFSCANVDQALSASAGADRDTWFDDGAVVAGEFAASLSEEELSLLRVIWTDRPLPWQRRCAKVLGSARLDKAIELLMDMVASGKPDVALAALESLESSRRRASTRSKPSGSWGRSRRRLSDPSDRCTGSCSRHS